MLTIALLDVLEVHACVRMVVVSIVKRVKFSQALMTDVSRIVRDSWSGVLKLLMTSLLTTNF